jgi:ribosome-interacting GTPase 1
MTKTPEEVKLRRLQEKLDGTQAMAEYKNAEGAARVRLARLRSERATREAASGPGKVAVAKAKPARKPKQPK